MAPPESVKCTSMKLLLNVVTLAVAESARAAANAVLTADAGADVGVVLAADALASPVAVPAGALAAGAGRGGGGGADCCIQNMKAMAAAMRATPMTVFFLSISRKC